MKKITVGLFVAAFFPLVLILGCGGSSPSTPNGPYGPAQNQQAMVQLGTAANYGVLSATGITNVGATTICGGLASTNPSVPGSIVVACGGASNIANTAATNAELDLGTAYTDAAGRTGGQVIPQGGDIGGQTIYQGLYVDTGNLNLLTSDVTLDAQGNANAVFIFQVRGDLVVASGRKVILTNGASAKNVFWQVTGYCSLNTTAAFAGNIMAHTAVTFNTGATLNGRALAETANVTFLSNTITVP